MANEDKIYHYIVVRKDLPVNFMIAQIVHASGESAALYGEPLPPDTRAVVLQATKREIEDLADETRFGVSRRVIVEDEGEYKGQTTAIGFRPGLQSAIKPLVKKLQCLKVNPDTVLRDRLDYVMSCIELHQKQTQGHDACWENDRDLWTSVGLATSTPNVPSWCEFMSKCVEYRQKLESAAQGDEITKLQMLIRQLESDQKLYSETLKLLSGTGSKII